MTRLLHGILRLDRVLKDRQGGAVAGFQVRPDQGVEVRLARLRPTHRQILQLTLVNKDARGGNFVSHAGPEAIPPVKLKLAFSKGLRTIGRRKVVGGDLGRSI